MPKGAGGAGREGRGGGSLLNSAIPESREAKIQLRDNLKAELESKFPYPGSKASEAEKDVWRNGRNKYLGRIEEVQSTIPRKIIGSTAAEKATAQFAHEVNAIESGTRYANRNVPGSTMLSEKEQRRLERMGKK
jgi:hypothetical protein